MKITDYARDESALEGKWFDLEEFGFKVKLRPLISKDFDIKTAEYVTQGMDNMESRIRAVCNHVLLDWDENMEDENGEPLKYTPEIGYKYLSDDRYYPLYHAILLLSCIEANFRKPIEVISGNS